MKYRLVDTDRDDFSALIMLEQKANEQPSPTAG